MLFSKKLNILQMEVKDLKDDEVYICILKNKKGKTIDDDEIEITGKELKYLFEMQGMKSGMIRYSNEHFYEVMRKKEEAPI